MSHDEEYLKSIPSSLNSELVELINGNVLACSMALDSFPLAALFKTAPVLPIVEARVPALSALINA